MKNLLKEIYLNVGDIGDDINEEIEFSELATEEVTWSREKIYDHDIKYVLDENIPHECVVKPTFAEIPLRLMYKVLDKYLTHDLHTPYGQMFNHWEQLIEHLREDLASYENCGIIDDVNDK